MMRITLPPLPKEQSLGWDTGYTESQLRARDLEVARVVREAAANSIKGRGAGSYEFYEIIRALEFKHAE